MLYDKCSEPISLSSSELGKVGKATKIPMDLIRAVNEQLTATAA